MAFYYVRTARHSNTNSSSRCRVILIAQVGLIYELYPIVHMCLVQQSTEPTITERNTKIASA